MSRHKSHNLTATNQFQGGYDGHSFLANVEVYDPVKDEWNDGIPLTSGRSGLASAVIYQPSCKQNYSQDCMAANLSPNREYDDEKKPPDNQDDDADLSSKGNGASYHLNCKSNFFSGNSGGQYDEVELIDCEEIKERLSGELYNMMTEIKVKLKEHCSKQETTSEQKEEIEQVLNDSHVAKMARLHIKCNKHSSCPLQSLKRRFRHFVSSRRNRNSCEALCKPK